MSKRTETKPASPRKLASCRENGAKSRGPVTDEGKARSCLNGITHGLLAASVVMAVESKEQFQRLRISYVENLRPADPIQADLVDDIVVARWRLRRIQGIEAALLDSELDFQRVQVDAEFELLTDDVRAALAYEKKANESPAFRLMNRYESRLSRQYYRALATLLELQKNNPPQSDQPLPAQSDSSEKQKLPNEPNPDIEHPPVPTENSNLATESARIILRYPVHPPVPTDQPEFGPSCPSA